jgi:hypothetical protein
MFGQGGQQVLRREPASGPSPEDVGWQSPDTVLNLAASMVLGHGDHDDDSAWITAAPLPVTGLPPGSP